MASANWSQATQVDRLWKWMFNRARGTSSAAFYEENIPTTFDVHASEVYAEQIPVTPPATTTSVVKKYYTAGEGGDGWITLTCDRKYNGNRVWVTLNTFNAAWSSGSGDVTQIVKNFVAPKYGAAYLVRVYDGTGTEIPILDASSWLFDYKAGVLTFESDRTETGLTTTACIKIKVYQYIGKMLTDLAAISSQARTIDVFESLDNQATFTLTKVPANNDIDLYMNGILLQPGATNSFTLSGNVITIYNRTEAGDVITVKYW